MFRFFRASGFAVRMAFAAAVFAVASMALAPLLWAGAGYLVSDSKRECYPLESQPGIGIGGLRWAEQCPEGYVIAPLPQPEKPFGMKFLEMLDSWFGLKKIILFTPTASQVAAVAGLVLVLRRLLQIFSIGFIEKLTHGYGTIVLTALISFFTVVQPLLEDGTFTAYELGLALVLTVGGAAAFWEALKALVGKSAVESNRIASAVSKLSRKDS